MKQVEDNLKVIDERGLIVPKDQFKECHCSINKKINDALLETNQILGMDYVSLSLEIEDLKNQVKQLKREKEAK